jgi:hypothetical protein
MITMKKIVVVLIGAIILAVFAGLYSYFYLSTGIEEEPPVKTDANMMVQNWAAMSGNRVGKVIYAKPPDMVILDLTTGRTKRIPGIVVDGAPGRRNRGKSPRPFWSSDGKKFVYRFNGRIYVSNEQGKKRIITNQKMDYSHETRWSWWHDNGRDWLVGPSIKKEIILVNPSDTQITKIAFGAAEVIKHCEITGENQIVYDNGSAIYVAPMFSTFKGIKISKGQSCRPCASPDNRVAWLPAPHIKYIIHDARSGQRIGELKAPQGEELYRLNWSNDPDFAVHMFGSRGDCRINVRKISTGEYLYIGSGWDPDLWVE